MFTAVLFMYWHIPFMFYAIGALLAFIVLGNLAGKLSKIIDGGETNNG